MNFFCTEVRFRDSQLGCNYFLFVRYWHFTEYKKHTILAFVCHNFQFCADPNRETLGCSEADIGSGVLSLSL